MRHDKELVKRRFTRSLAAYDSIAVVQREIAVRLAGLIESHASSMTKGIEIGAGTGFLTRELVRMYPETRWITNDIVERSRQYIPEGNNIEFRAADGEYMPLGKDNDLVASASTVQWFDSLKGFISHAAASLASGGLLALSTFGPDNFREITATTGNALEYYPADQIAGWMTETRLEVVVEEQWKQSLTFDSPVEVLRHIKATGVNAIDKKRWTHSRLKQFEDEYRRMYDPVTLTFDPIIIIARKK